MSVGNLNKQEGNKLITTTRLDGSKLYISPHQIEYMEETPDTVIYLVSGKRIIVRENSTEIIEKLIKYWQEINSQVTLKTEKTGEDNRWT